VKTLNSTNQLNDDHFHHVTLYKRGKYVQLIVDKCMDAEIRETLGGDTVQNQEGCEISGTIPGRWRYINGLYPLQIGGMRDTTLGYPDLESITKGSDFQGCVRNIIDNGIMYDLKMPLDQFDTIVGCPTLKRRCPVCYQGQCDMSKPTFTCVCKFGWKGEFCSERK
jgi:hypothetical protein